MTAFVVNALLGGAVAYAVNVARARARVRRRVAHRAHRIGSPWPK